MGWNAGGVPEFVVCADFAVVVLLWRGIAIEQCVGEGVI